ncbi:hypothetical protein C8J57DRAFT_1220249 [Mycena rebaudengoi]|nr:hypothetical protein C8J57DRAFT_1220249 [Mycena rebaudengoi]
MVVRTWQWAHSDCDAVTISRNDGAVRQVSQRFSRFGDDAVLTRSDIRGSISDLDTRILELEQALATARLERQDLQTRLDSYKYPILTLPIEITSEIFVHFLPPYPERPPAIGLSSPHILGHIFRSWRELALSTSRLWQAIELHQGDLPWSQLTTISVMSIREADCVNIFQHAAALVQFCCHRVIRDDDEDTSPVAPLRSLQSLALEYHYTTPALQHLSISDSRLWGSQTIAKLHALILRSRCTLASLRITRTLESEAFYRAAFPLIPTITVTDCWS